MAADEDVNSEGFAAADRFRVMDADAAMNLIMQSDLSILFVAIAAELHAIHAQVRFFPAGPGRIFRIHLGSVINVRRLRATTQSAEGGE